MTRDDTRRPGMTFYEKKETRFEPLWVELVGLRCCMYVSHWHESASPLECVLFNVCYETWCGFSHYHMEWIELFNCRSDDRSNDRSDGMFPRIVSVKLSNASASVRVSISLSGWSIHLIPNPRFFSSLYYVKRIYTPNKFRSCDHRRFTRVLRCSTNWAIGV